MNSGRLKKQQKDGLKRKRNKNYVRLIQTLKRASLKFVLLRKHRKGIRRGIFKTWSLSTLAHSQRTEYSAHIVHLKSRVVFRTSLTGHGSYKCDEILLSIISSLLNIFPESEIRFFSRVRCKMFVKLFWAF